MTLIGVGGGLAGKMAASGAFPEWASLVVAFGAALLAVVHFGRTQPRKIEELGSAIRLAVVAGPVGATLVWVVFAIFS